MSGKSALRILLGNLSYRARSLSCCHCHDSNCKDRQMFLKLYCFLGYNECICVFFVRQEFGTPFSIVVIPICYAMILNGFSDLILWTFP